LLRDPSSNISDAISGKFVPDLLAKHRVNDWGHLGCPYCERFFPREDLAVVSYTEPSANFAGVAWGCVDCTGGFAVEITLDRVRTLDDAMRWTIHMLSKDWMLHPVAVRGWIASMNGIFGPECDRHFPARTAGLRIRPTLPRTHPAWVPLVSQISLTSDYCRPHATATLR
jgi:hypothetical protein